MRTLGNIVWLVIAFGWLTALLTFLLGTLLVLLVITAPIGRGLLELSRFYLTPFSCVMVKRKDVQGEANAAFKAYGAILSVVYVVIIGIWLFIGGVIQVIGLFCTIIGIPIAIVVAKSLGSLLNPVGKKCVSKAMYEEIQRRKASGELDKLQGIEGAFDIELTDKN